MESAHIVRNITRRMACLIGLTCWLAGATAETFVINPGIGGAWFDPQQDGQGFLIEVVPGQPPVMILSWYTYAESGGAQAWFFGTGEIVGQDTAVIELLKPQGGVFDDPMPVDKPRWGQADVRFHSCTEGVIDYRAADGGPGGSVSVVRVASDSVCQSFEARGSELYSGAGEFAIKSQGDLIATTLQLPAEPGPFPVIVLVHGSGLATRANVQFIADLLTQRGFAALSYDKRGVGESGGRFEEAGPFNDRLQLLAEDVEAMVTFLRHHRAIDEERIGLLGISQGGWINAIVGGRAEHLAFMVSVVGPAVTIGEEIHYSNQTNAGASIAEASNAVRDFNGFHGYDPIPDLARIQFPALWVLGGLDRSIPTDITIERLGALIESGSPFEIQLYPEGNHGLRDPQGNPIPYLTPPGGVFDWIESILAAPNALQSP